MALEGSLSDFGLADIFQLIYFQRKTGILTLEGRLDRIKLLFIEGNIAGAESRKRIDDNRVGKILVKKGLITDEDLRLALAEQQKTGSKIGKILISRELVNTDVLREILGNQVTETVVQLFGWKEGTYEFSAQRVLQDKELPVSVDTQHLLMEGLRIVDEWSQINDRITLDIVFRKRMERPSGLSLEEKEVLSFVDGENDVSTIIDLSDKDNFEVSKTLLALMERGVIEAEAAAPVLSEAFTPETGISSKLLNSVAPVAVLISFLLSVTFAALLNKPDIFREFKTSEAIEDIRFRIETYHIEHAVYPQSLASIATDKDAWGRPYVYRVADDSFRLASAGPDGIDGTADDIY